MADVSGHGVPAALIASMVKVALAAQAGDASDPAAVLAGMNRILHGNLERGFVTAADGVTEALSPAGEPFGDERLRDLLAASGDPDAILGRLAEWTGRELDDDVTLVVAQAVEARYP